MNSFKDYYTIAIIGTAKNAGKTTALNALIKTTKNKAICITSIGLDGEKIDQLTKQEKPSIYATKGMLVATAKETLKMITSPYTIIEETTISSSLGNIVLLKMEEDGAILLAGPSSLDDLLQLKTILHPYQLDHFIIDGALFRKSSAASKLSDGLILSTGGALNSNINTVIQQTVLTVELLNLPTVKSTPVAKTHIINNDQSVVYDDGTFLSAPSTLLQQAKNAKKLVIAGAITNRLIETLISYKDSIPPLLIIISDFTMINCDLSLFAKLSLLGHKVKTRHHVPLILLTINPTSPYHSGFDPNLFEQAMHKALPTTPIIDIKRKELTYE